MKSNELIHRYLLGIASDDDVQELESRLRGDEALQDELLLQAELDAHLRQAVQLGSDEGDLPQLALQRSSPNVWKWVSGISTLAAAILLTLLVLNFPPQKTAFAYPSLGELAVNVPWAEKNIWAAAGRGDLPSLRRELRENVPVDARLYDELTPLHVAALFNQQQASELLLLENADLTLTDGKGNTPLHMAAFLGHTDVVDVLLSAGADPTVRNYLGFNSTDLVSVVWNSELEEFYRKLEKELNKTIDLEKVRAERPKILALLSSASRLPEGGTPTVSICQAVIFGNSAAVRQHVAAGTDLNEKEDLGGSTPLALAAVFGHTDIARTLIEAGADLELRNKSGGTALHQACFFCRPEIVELLLKSGADPNRTNNDRLTPLDLVTKNLDDDSVGVYKYVYDSLNLELDIGHIKDVRPQIAGILRKHVGSKAGENGNRKIK